MHIALDRTESENIEERQRYRTAGSRKLIIPERRLVARPTGSGAETAPHAAPDFDPRRRSDDTLGHRPVKPRRPFPGLVPVLVLHEINTVGFVQRAVVTQLPPDLRHDDVERGKCQRQAYDVQQRRDFVAPQRSQKITKCDLHNTLFGFNHVNRVGIGDAPRADELHGADDQQHHCPAQGEEPPAERHTLDEVADQQVCTPAAYGGPDDHGRNGDPQHVARQQAQHVGRRSPVDLAQGDSLLRRRISSPR